MEYQNDIAQLLEMLTYPAFCVSSGTVTHVNQDAAHSGICANEPVSKYLATGQQEYEEFQGGSLYLTVNAAGICLGATVSRFQDFDIFVLDQDEQQAKLQTMALAAKELRTPLSNIMAVANNMFPIVSQDEDPAMQALAAQINRGLYQMHRIICNMSDAYRYSIDAQIDTGYRNICAISNEFWTNSIDVVSHAGVTLKYSGLQESINCLVSTEKLERAFSNILSNALKFTPKGGTIDVRLTRKSNMLYLSVFNSGDTVPEELRGSIHSRYLRQPGIEDIRYGIGLGMVLVRSAAAAHGGTLLMEHLKDQGTRVTMTMQIRQDSSSFVRSPTIPYDYAGELNHWLVELSESLPAELYSQ